LDYKITLWQLDEIVGWRALDNPPISVAENKTLDIIDEVDEEKLESYEDFGLESHLEDFLVENWENYRLVKSFQSWKKTVI